MIIYKVTCLINNKIYIGQSKQALEKRKKSHIKDAKSKCKNKCIFHKALSKYGIDNFIWEIIYSSDSCKDLDEKEIFYISYYDSHYENGKGYNMTLGGNGSNGYIFTDDVKEKIRIKAIGRKHSDKTKKILSDLHIGKTPSEETKRKISETNKGKIPSKETRRKISEANKGRTAWNEGKLLSEEHKQKISESEKGKKQTENTKQKISQARKNDWNKPEYRQHHTDRVKGNNNPMYGKCGQDNPFYGKTHSLEVLEKKSKNLYIITYPNGGVKEVKVLSVWCKENNMNIANVKYHMKTNKEYMGFKFSKIPNELISKEKEK